MKGALAIWTATLIAACSLVTDATDAQACGGFFRRKVVEDKQTPSLAYEQALIVFDAAARREHFIREVVFRASNESFGFVVPAPSRPEVAEVKPSPFLKLQQRFPFEGANPDQMDRARAGGGARGARAPRNVEVLDVRSVGSFTAFVLAASDQQALSHWLNENGLVSSPHSDAWLAHYVKLGFFYVAMRYEPPKAASDETKAETVRISFDSPLPYYPYLEPENPGQSAQDPRMLEVWLAASRRFVPVAAHAEDDRTRWVRPLREGVTYKNGVRAELEDALENDAKLLAAGDTLILQRFADQKRSRAGFGDIVFVPSDPTTLDEATRTALLRFVPLLSGARP